MRLSVFFVVIFLTVMPAKYPQAKTQLTSAALSSGVKLPAAIATNKLPHQLIYPGDLFYPVAQAKRGLQGEVTLEIYLSKTGKATEVKVINTSKSVELDKNALTFVNTGYWKLPENGLKYYEGVYSLNVVFLRDSVLTINTKTCAEFNADLKYFRSIHGSEAVKNFGALELMANISTVQLMKNQGANGALKFVRSVEVINTDAINGCAKKTTELFVKTYAKATKKHGIKF
jgi:TonB family protein